MEPLVQEADNVRSPNSKGDNMTTTPVVPMSNMTSRQFHIHMLRLLEMRANNWQYIPPDDED